MKMRQLIEDNMKLVYYLIRKEYPTYINDEDIVQCGMVGLCIAAEKWDESKSSFSTFAVICIRSAIQHELKRRSKYQNDLSLDYEVDDGEGGTCSFGDFIVGDKDVIYVGVNTDALTKREKQVFELFQTGLSYADIARKLGVSRQAVWKSMRNIRIKNGERG